MSEATPILHMLDPRKHVSPFDVNMAADAGYKVIVPYTNVELADVTPLIQDAIFSRPPNYGVRTGFFMGGKDAIIALDMIEAAKKAMVPPFECSVFADPAGSFTTAAAMVACVERVLKNKFNRGWKGAKVTVFGATGVVGFASSIIAALEGAEVRLVAHRGVDRVIKSAAVSKERFGVDLEPVAGETAGAEARHHRQRGDHLSRRRLPACRWSRRPTRRSPRSCSSSPTSMPCRPQASMAWTCSWTADSFPVLQALGVGALAIGDIKYKCESGLFKQMLASDKPVAYDFRHAYELCKKLTGLA